MDAHRFFRLATRLFAYQSVMTRRVEIEQQEKQSPDQRNQLAVPPRTAVRKVPLETLLAEVNGNPMANEQFKHD